MEELNVLVSLLLERFGKKMGATACFHAMNWICAEAQQLCSRELVANHNLTELVQTYQVKNRFAKINTDCVKIDRALSRFAFTIRYVFKVEGSAVTEFYRA